MALKINNVTIISPFRITSSTCVGTLAVGNNCLVKVDFRATNACLEVPGRSLTPQAEAFPGEFANRSSGCESESRLKMKILAE